MRRTEELWSNMRKPKKHLSCDSLILGLKSLFKKIKDPRSKKEQECKYKLEDIGLSVFACMFFQDPSLLAFQRRMQDKGEKSNFNTIFKVEDIKKDILPTLFNKEK